MSNGPVAAFVAPGGAELFPDVALDSSLVPMALADPEGVVIKANPAYLGLSSRPAPAALGRSLDDYWRPVGETRSLLELLASQDCWQGEVTGLRPGETPGYAQLSLSLARDADGRVLGMLAVFQDLAPFRQREEELRRRAGKLDERVKELNALYTISGLSEDPHLTTGDYLRRMVGILPAAWQHSADACARVSVEGQRFESPGFRETAWQQRSPIRVGERRVGTVTVCYLSEHPALDEGPFLREERALLEEAAKHIARFVERWRAARALQRSQARYRDLFEESPIALFEQDFSAVKSRLTELNEQGLLGDARAYFEAHPEIVADCIALVKNLYLNRASLTLYGASAKEELLVELDRLVPPESHQMFIDELVWMASGRTRFVWEGVNRKLSGERIHIRLHWSAVPGSEETLERVLVAIEDITARRQAEAALQDSELRYRAVSELTSDFAYTMRVSPSGAMRVEWITDAFTRITGYAPKNAGLNGRWLRIVHPEDRPRAEEANERLLAGEAIVIELRLLARNGEVRWIRLHSRPETDPHTGIVVRIRGAGQDITDYKRIEQEMIRAERVAAMGQVVATLAHEVKNPLQALTSNLELLRDFPLEPDEQEESLRICRQEVERLKAITHNVLNLGRIDAQSFQRICVVEAWQQTYELLKQPLRERGVTVTADLPPDLPPVNGCSDQIVQVLLNLALNALESMPGGGALEVIGRQAGDQLSLSISNDGPPIPRDHLEHIFEPFFTTKPNGSGLGLFISHAIIEHHGGSLTVANLPSGRGVRFTLRLPLAGEDASG